MIPSWIASGLLYALFIFSYVNSRGLAGRPPVTGKTPLR